MDKMVRLFHCKKFNRQKRKIRHKKNRYIRFYQENSHFLLTIFFVLNLLSHVECYNLGMSWRNSGAFAALKEDGTVAAWGQSGYGGSGVPSGLSNVRAIYSTYYAFAALKQDGTVAAWGDSSYGGSGVPSGLSNVREIYSTYGAVSYTHLTLPTK